jgi:hypothetical protein
MLSSGTLLTTVTVISFPTARAGWGLPLLSSQVGCLFTVLWRISPPTLFSAQGTPPSLLCFFCCCLLLSFFSLFFPGWGSVCPGGMLIWPRVVCGSTVCCLAHLVVCFSRAGKSWCLILQEPSSFLCLPWSGDAMRKLWVWHCRSFTSCWWFFLQGISLASLQDFTLGSMLSASSL